MKKISSILFVLFALTLSAGDFVIPFRKSNAVIDGNDKDACWQTLNWNSGFVQNVTGKAASADTRFKIFHNGKAFYLLAEALEPDMKKLVVKSYRKDGISLWKNDSIEINFVADPKVMSFYKFIVDAAGETDDMRCTDDNTDREIYACNAGWDGNAVVKTLRLPDRWRLEMMIPIGAMELPANGPASWRFNIARNRYAGKAEDSSWSFIRRSSNVTPKQFRTVTLEKFQPEYFRIDAAPLQVRFTRGTDGKFIFAPSLDLVNRSGSFKRVVIEYKLQDPETKKVLHSFRSEKRLYRNLLVKAQDKFQPAVPGDYLVSAELMSVGTVPCLLKKISQRMKLEYQPLTIRMVRPAYRNNIYATMPDKTIEAIVKAEGCDGLSLKAELTGPGGVRETRKITASAAGVKVLFDGSKLPDGRWFLRISGQKGKEKLSCEVPIRKLPYRKGEVWLDSRGAAYVDGKLFLPYGFSDGWGENSIGCSNVMDSTIRYKSVEAARKGMQSLYRQTGIRSIIHPFTDLNGKSNWDNTFFTDAKLKGSLLPEQRKRIEAFVPGASQAEELFGWYMADEPEGKDHNPRWYEDAWKLIAELDPYHPVIMVNYSIHGVRLYYTGGDITAPDCYPHFWEDGTSDMSRNCTAEIVKAGAALRPTWITPLATLWPGWSPDGKKRGIPPDYFDQRQQLYQSFIHNAKGVLLYNYSRGQYYSSCIIGPRVSGYNLQKIKEYVLAATVPGGVTVKTAPVKPDFQAGVKVYGNQFCLMANNTSLKDVKAEFTLKNRFSGTLYTEGAARAVTVKNGQFSDTFRGKETILYFSDRKAAASLPTVESTLKEIADHQARRNNPKNLLTRGEMLNTLSGKQIFHFDKTIPKITASSDKKYYISSQIGTSLYFLIDGLTEVDQVTFTWSPMPNDKAPWVEFKLPKKHPMHKAVIYTVNGNLTDCDAVVNGKKYSVRNNSANRIVIPLGGDVSDTLRINILKRKTTAGGLKNALMTEVELY